MKYFNLSSDDYIQTFLSTRTFGDKLGNYVTTVSKIEDIYSNDSTYVLLGIPSVSDTTDFDFKSDFEKILEPILNIEQNPFNDGSNLLILGDLNPLSILESIDESLSDLEKLDAYKAVEERVISEISTSLINAGKIPLLVGGNSQHTFNLSKSIGLETNSKLNILDITSRCNLGLGREIEGENNLEAFQLYKYDAFGISKNYVTAKEYAFMSASKRIEFQWYEDCLHLTTLDKCVKFKNALDFLQRNLAFKLDLKCIQGFPQSNEYSSGFSIRDIRTFIKMLRKEKIHFAHFCGFGDQLPAAHHILSFFISDFIRNED